MNLKLSKGWCIILINEDFYTRQKEAYSGVYTDNHNNIYDLCDYCGYWSLYMRVGDNGHTKTIISNSNLSNCLYEIAKRGLVRQ
jgi:hypothetical protein